jgi:hypothetical protein
MTIPKYLFKELETKESGERCFRSWQVFHTDEGGYTENEIAMRILNDGALALDMGNNYLYLYPEQVEHLRKVLEIL